MKLHRAWAGLPFVRALFELSLQFEYLMQDAEAGYSDSHQSSSRSPSIREK